MKTLSTKSSEIKRKWFIVDATNKTLGRFSSEIARRLHGKHKSEYTPHVDVGDYIIVINVEKIKVSAKKSTNKIYYHHTGYIGNLKSINFEQLQAIMPTRILRLAVKGMMPKNKLGRIMMKKLKVYAGTRHKHIAQQPQLLDI